MQGIAVKPVYTQQDMQQLGPVTEEVGCCLSPKCCICFFHVPPTAGSVPT